MVTKLKQNLNMSHSKIAKFVLYSECIFVFSCAYIWYYQILIQLLKGKSNGLNVCT